MYKIVGADGNQYGPVSAEQIRSWITEGRANGQTVAQAEGATDWKKLNDFPEFADLLARSVPPLTGTLPITPVAALDLVSAPATGLIVVAVLGFVLSLGGLGMNLSGKAMTFPGMDNNTEAFARMFAGTLGIVSTIVSLALSGIILYGALKMKRLENYGLAMTVSILAVIPCLSPCCILGLPLGIWSAVVLSKPEVRSSFH